VQEVADENQGILGWAVEGRPADCVKLALRMILPWQPDLIVSGLNAGSNAGINVLYSGTVAAAMEGYLFGIPAIAFSQVERGWVHLDAAAAVARQVVQAVMSGEWSQASGSLPVVAPWLLNVNIPNRADAHQLEWVVTRLGRRHASEPVIQQTNPRGEVIYWIGPPGNARDATEGTDFYATAQAKVSITPLQVDLTHHAHLANWSQYFARQQTTTPSMQS
jgi:5'-nucleotidase